MDGPGNRVKVCLQSLLLNHEELEYCLSSDSVILERLEVSDRSAELISHWFMVGEMQLESACEVSSRGGLSAAGYRAMSFLEPVFGIIPSPSDALAVAKTIPPGPIGGERRMALMPEASIRGLQQYIESLMGTAGPSVLTKEQQARISASQHSISVRVNGIQTDRRW